MSLNHLLYDRTNLFGTVATGLSAGVASIQDDHFQATVLFIVSLVVGLLTAVHLTLQIRQILKAVSKEKIKELLKQKLKIGLKDKTK